MLAAAATGAVACIVDLSDAVAAEAAPPPASAPSAQATESKRAPEATRGILRAANCDRCHGKDYDGLAAPSIVAYAKTQSREMFVRMVLDGDPPRGMPGYRGYPLIADNIDAIRAYFLADGR